MKISVCFLLNGVSFMGQTNSQWTWFIVQILWNLIYHSKVILRGEAFVRSKFAKVKELTFAYGFSKKVIKKQTPHWMKKKTKKKKTKTKTRKVCIKIFEENKKEQNLKAINCQKLLYAN